MVHNDPIIIESLKRLFEPYGMPKIFMFTNDNALIKQLVMEGKALSTYTELLGQRDPLVSQGKLLLKKLKCKNDMQKVNYVYAYRNGHQIGTIEKAFIQSISKKAKENLSIYNALSKK